MDNSERSLLQKDAVISLSLKPEGTAPEPYIIRGVAGQGGSCVCYDAIRVRDGQLGKLKEFYPMDFVAGRQRQYYSLQRKPDGRLVPGGGTVAKFDKLCRDFLDTYSRLNRVVAENPKNLVLKNYIQNGEQLYSFREPGEDLSALGATVYVWSPGMAGRGFDSYLADIRQDPAKNANFRLHDILNTVLTFTDSIKALHNAGLMHLDIKPSNFLVPVDSDDRVNTDRVSLFDMNTLHSVGSQLPHTMGTPGFDAPELATGRVDNRTDIYSIGAMLFYGLVIHPEVPEGCYDPRFYSRLDRLVKDSALVGNAGAELKLVTCIANILKKSLAPRKEDRYDSCSALMQDLRRAVFEARKNAVDPRLLGQNKKMAVVDVNEQGLSDPGIVIQKLLYDRPLYEALQPGEKTLRVLVLGSGEFGQKFMDHCLQAGQIKDCRLELTAASPTPAEDRENYLRFRPAMDQFVDVDGSLAQDPRAYGSIRFRSLNDLCKVPGDTLHFVRGKASEAQNGPVVEKLLEGKYHYIFIALGTTAMNREIARLCAGAGCPVCYVSEKTPGKKQPQSDPYPVYIRRAVTPDSIDPRLERMAFNTHLCWNGTFNPDIREEMKDPYYYSASLASALSIPYKLYSIGIRLDKKGDFLPAAEAFDREVLQKAASDPSAKARLDTLVALEHRRWVLNLLADGWQAPLDGNGRLRLEDCVLRGSVKDKVRKLHPCLVFSTEAAPLSGPEYTQNNRAKWEDPLIDPALDPLDRMAVELHQVFRRHAEKYKATNPLQGEDVRQLQRLVEGTGEQRELALKQFLYCLTNILEGVEGYIRQLDHYRRSFCQTLEALPEAVRQQARERVDRLCRAFFPVVEANLCRDYKQYDRMLVEKIPFILTYRFQPRLAMVFADGAAEEGRNDAVFASVASATVLSPRELRYLYYCTPRTQPELLVRKLDAVLGYLQKRRVHCRVRLAVAFPDPLGDDLREQLQQALQALEQAQDPRADAALESWDILDCRDAAHGCRRFLEYLQEYPADLFDGSVGMTDSPLDSGLLARAVLEAGIPYFEFDRRKENFSRYVGCGYLRYIQDMGYIRIRDMFRLMNATDIQPSLPEFGEDHGVLWEIYTGDYLETPDFDRGVENWNRLCGLLDDYEKQRPPLASFRPGSCGREECVYILPALAQGTAEKLLSELEKAGVVADCSVSGYTSQECRVRFCTDPENRAGFEEIFEQAELQELLSAAVEREEARVRVLFSGPVTDLDLSQDRDGSLFALLQALHQHRFLRQLRRREDRVSFRYAADRVKRVLTDGGGILQIYTYYQMLKTGWFDDVAWDFTFRWQEGQVKTKLDIVATKGLRSMIVECRASPRLLREDYQGLHSVADLFGIGTVKVLVGDPVGSARGELDRSNRLQRSRGRQMNIVTVTGEQEIRNIGRILQALL